MRPRRFVALDRDGTIIVEHHYLSDPLQVELLPGAANGLRQMAKMGYGLIVVTNQSGIRISFLLELCRRSALFRLLNSHRVKRVNPRHQECLNRHN